MSPRAHRAVVAAAVLIVACLYVYGFVLNRPEEQAEDSRPRTGPREQLVIDGAVIQGMDAGVTAWRIAAESVSVVGDQRSSSTHVRGIIHGEIMRDGEPYMTFTAGSGQYAARTAELVLDGGVVFHQDGEQLLRSDQVIWKPDESRAVVPGPAVITTSSGEVKVDSLQLDVTADKLYSEGQLVITGTSSSGDIAVRGGRIVFDPKAEALEATGPTTIEFEIGH